MDELKEAILLFDPAVCSFSHVEGTVRLPKELELLQILSNKAKKIFVKIEEGYKQETSTEY
jgi:hypothetical protein